MVSHSLRWRLQIWHGLMLLAVLAGFGLTAYRLQYANELRRVDQELQDRLGLIREAVRRPLPMAARRLGGQRPPGPPRQPAPPPDQPNEEPPPPENFQLGPGPETFFSTGTNATYYVVWLRNGQEFRRSQSAPESVPLPLRIRGTGPTPATRTQGVSREIYQFIRGGECVLVGRSIAPEMANLRQFALMLTALGAGIMTLGLAGGWWLATRAIRPIDDISAAATRIATGDLSHRIDVADTDNELGRLAEVLNLTFARLEAAFKRQQQFTADASHELRTPVSVILSQTQATLARQRQPEEYRDALEACRRAAERMHALTESLLTLARLDSGAEELARHPVDLGRITADCLELLRPLAAEHNVTFQLNLERAHVLGDPAGLAQVVTNLIVNAILHGGNDGTVKVGTGTKDATVWLEVSDSGPGIPQDAMSLLFERFHRGDPSRTGSRGGSGLGLAICRAIVEAHGGSIGVSSTVGRGTTFTARLPASET